MAEEVVAVAVDEYDDAPAAGAAVRFKDELGAGREQVRQVAQGGMGGEDGV